MENRELEKLHSAFPTLPAHALQNSEDFPLAGSSCLHWEQSTPEQAELLFCQGHAQDNKQQPKSSSPSPKLNLLICFPGQRKKRKNNWHLIRQTQKSVVSQKSRIKQQHALGTSLKLPGKSCRKMGKL